MGVYVRPLSQQDLLDIATHFASLPDPFGRPPETPSRADEVARRLIANGDPMRGVASCAACHGLRGLVPGAPGLRGHLARAIYPLQSATTSALSENDVAGSHSERQKQ